MKKKTLLIILAVAMIFAFVVERTEWGSPLKYADTKNGKELTVVNSSFCVPENWQTDLIELSCGEKVDRLIYPDLQAMFDTALSEGVDLVVRSGYRSYEQQKAIMINKISQLRLEGFDKEDAKENALKWVAMPGTSEHELGLAVDINAENGTNGKDAYKWLSENSYKFGFIVRYPASKSEITGISYEPWHFRYVGKKHAMEIYKSGLCLEEYIRFFGD